MTIKRNIEEYFDYRWDKDKNNVLNNGKYASFMEQLSEDVKDELLKKFLYDEFLKAYYSSFDFEKEQRVNLHVVISHSRYTWEDRIYRDFMF